MSLFQFPDQRIPETEKDEAWHKEHLIGYIGYLGHPSHTVKKAEMTELYYAATAQLSPKEEERCRKMITERYGMNFGPQYFVYPLIENRIEQVVGEYRKRPLKRRAMVNNEDAVMKKLDAKIDMLLERELRVINKGMEQEIGFAPETEKPKMELPPDVEEHFAKNYRTLSEEIAEDVLYQLLIVKKEKEKMYDALKHYLISGHTFGVHDEKDGHPSVHIPHPLDCTFDNDLNSAVQKDMQMFNWSKTMTPSEIRNKFKLTPKQSESLNNYTGVNTGQIKNYNHWFQASTDNTPFRVRIASMKWISRKVAKFKVINNNGVEELKILPDEYKLRKDRGEEIGKNIREIEIDNVRHVTMIGPDIVLSFGSEKDQLQTAADPKKRYLDVVGLVNQNPLGVGAIRSLAKKLLYLQDMASEIMYEIRLNMRQIDGNVMVYDTAMMPKEFLKFGEEKALEKVNFYLKRDRMQIINSKDKRSNAYANSANVSQKGRMAEMISLLALVEDIADRISGIPKESRGDAGQYQKATSVEANLSSGSARQEEYFGVFDSFAETYLERMVMKSKSIYRKDQVFTFFSDQQQKFLKIQEPYMLDDMGIHIGDNRLEYERKTRMDQMADRAFGQSQDPEIMLHLIRTWNADSATEAEGVFKAGVRALAESRAAMQEAAQQAEAQKAQIAQAQIDSSERQHQERMQNNIDVANIYAENSSEQTNLKEDAANVRKGAEIERDILLANKDKNASN